MTKDEILLKLEIEVANNCHMGDSPEVYFQKLVAVILDVTADVLADGARWSADARRLSGCLLAIRDAPDDVPAEVLKSVAYDAALNCITPDVARFQIERRTKIAREKGDTNGVLSGY